MQVKKIIVLSFNSIKHKNNKFHFVIIKGQQRNVPAKKCSMFRVDRLPI